LELKGQIEEFIYQNESNSYSIAVFITEDEEVVTVVGYLPFIAVGDTLKLQGKMVVHQEYGEQFKIETFEKMMPETAAALEKYLASGTIKGIGPATARKIIDKFGEETLTVFKFEPLRLAEIKGIVWQIVSFLENFGIGANNSKKVYDALGVNAVEKIQENPYILIDIVYGVNFNNIDKIAMQIGIPMDSDYRVKSGIKYALLVASYNGHTCVQKENLIEYVKSILDVTDNIIQDNIINLNVSSEIHIIEKDDIGGDTTEGKKVITTQGGVLLGKMSFKMLTDERLDMTGFELVKGSNTPQTGIKINLDATHSFEAQSVFRFTNEVASKDADLSNLVLSSGKVNEENPDESTYKEYNLTPAFDKETKKELENIIKG